MAALAERHAFQIDNALWLQCRAWGKCGGLGHLWLLVDVHSVGLCFCLPVSSQLLQNPAHPLFPHGHLDVDVLVCIASHEFRAPDDDVMIFEELHCDVEALVVE